MPELPEVETVRRGLERLVVGRVVAGVDVESDKSWRVDPACRLDRDLVGRAVTSVRRRGKVLILDLGEPEPLAGLATVALAAAISPALPYVLAFAAGAMIYVVIEELIPEAHAGEHSNASTVCAAVGFVLMMILDVALG